MSLRSVGTRFVLMAVSAGLLGCGGGAHPAAATPVFSNLSGNWLLAGSLPIFPAPLSSGVRLAMTFAIDGTQLSGHGQYLVSCGNDGGGASLSVEGTLAGDGSFTAQTDQSTVNRGASLTVSGHVPSHAGLPWTGSYTLDTTNAGSCKVQVENPFTATSIANFTGTYAGNGAFTDGTAQTPVNVVLTLQQGNMVEDASGKSVFNAALLSGTIAITGIPCFSKGSIVTPNAPASAPGDVSGGMIHASFRMDDGSTMLLTANALDNAGDTLQTVVFGVLGGDCATSTTRSVRIVDLTRGN